MAEYNCCCIAIGKREDILGMSCIKIFQLPQLVSQTQPHDKTVFTDSSKGCCLLVSESLFNKVGLFDNINCPQLAADGEFHLSAGARGHLTVRFADVSIRHLDTINYYSNLGV